ncbi:hypothetical protein HK105_205576 [Polyrhizophydium stewartii]|uniref:L-type lectin-like domain-containing protein n=1 Tax=Polyrhizophydium stewartii TaxID=2732419 RepID=A0ABR4N5T9_9FUNG
MLVSLAVAALAALAPRPVVADHQWDLEHAHARFDYRRSFKQPFFLRDDSLPYFKATESVVHGPDFQRLAMGVPFHRGSIWATKPNAYPEWKVEMKFRISGRGPIGGDGFVLWYTHSSEPQGELDYYGHSSRFRGKRRLICASVFCF